MLMCSTDENLVLKILIDYGNNRKADHNISLLWRLFMLHGFRIVCHVPLHVLNTYASDHLIQMYTALYTDVQEGSD